MRKSNWIAGLMLLGLSWACRDKPAPPETAMPKAYFDLQQYFEAEISRLNREKPLVIKKVTIDGETEEIQTDSLDYTAELQIFLDADINRPAWSGRYIEERTESGSGAFTLRYTATDNKMPFKVVTVMFQNEVPTAIDIERSTNTLLAGTEQKLSYRVAQGYTVHTVQQALFRTDQDMGIEVTFLKE